MGKIFNLDAPIVQTMGKVGEMMIFSVIWLVCCLPVVTVGAATAALFHIMFNMHRERSTKVSDYFRAFAANFKKATALWLLLLLAAAVLLAGFYAVVLAENELLRLALLGVYCMVLFAAFAASVYLFPLTAFFENTVGATVRNALGMALGNLKNTVLACALVLLPLVLSLVWEKLFVVTLLLWVVLGPGAVAYGVAGLLLPVFRRYVPEAFEE